ncbi:hypothetical protein CsSME_00034375 [Camellia sinensis var. sinensis]
MGGIGKTTLAKKVYDSQEVVAHFNCKAWITVSQSYKPEELLKTMIKQLSGIYVLLDEGIESLIVKLRGYLSEKRYIIVFNDVATFCKETSMDHVHELEVLSEERLGNAFARKPFNWTLRVIVPLSWRKYHMQLLESVKVCHLQLQL